ncbi:MAG: DUF4102 domain-containing protein, partial [Nitrospira sp.]|nr:DUF4102 domain-containing protein [Nitrospira sp.]
MASEMLKPYTMAAIERLKPAPAGKRDTYLHPRIPGLILRVTDKGAKSFAFEARVKGGEKVKETIGRFPACTVETAEAEAKRLSAQMVRGIDPREARRRAGKDPTFAELFKAYMEEPGRR